jgi:uncharacterized delta-60 repeat protein
MKRLLPFLFVLTTFLCCFAGKAQAVTPQISAGMRHTVAVKTDGTLWAWGGNDSGQLGDGTTTQRLAPVQIGSGFAAVSAGAYHTVAVKADGTLWAWGGNDYGRLGDGTTTQRLVPVQIGSGFAAVAAANSHSVAVKTDGTLWAWGYNGNGQLGDGTTTQRLVPVQVGSGFVSVDAGGSHNLAVKADGTLWAWGNNSNGQLGDGTTNQRLVPAQIGSGFAVVAAANSHSVAVKTDGTLWAWGYNGNGRLGDGTTTQRLVPVQVGSGFVSSDAGDSYTVAMKADGTVWAWGYNNNGQLGDGTITQRLAPVQIGSGFAKVAAGSSHAVAVKPNGTVWAWGSNYNGQLGDGTTTWVKAPVQIGTGFATVAAGDSLTVAVKTNGNLWAWGYNYYGQLGDGTTTSKNAPEQIGSEFAKVDAGRSHTVAVKADGSLWAWGTNDWGQLGDGTYIQRLVPKQIGSEFATVSTHYLHTAAVKTDGTLWAWGYNHYGQLGDGTTATRNAPVQIGSEFTTVATGDTHTVAVKADGTLWAWGRNDWGQLGDGTTTQRLAPVQIGSEFATVAAAGSRAVAIKTDGTLWAWGENSSGLLGDGTTTQKLVPVQIGSEFTTVAVGFIHSVAVKTDGTLWAWGSNDNGQLGDGTTTQRLAPVQIGSGFAAAAVGYYHTAAVKLDGTLWTWGANYYGQLGFDPGWNPRQALINLDAFDANVSAPIQSIAIQTDGKILIGGVFVYVDGFMRSGIARLNADGSLDSSFNPNANKKVRSIAVQTDGKIMIGGEFTTVGGVTHNYIARLNSDGSLDSINISANNYVESIGIQADGKIIITGLFTTINGVTRNGMARLNADGSLDGSFNPNVSGQGYSSSIQSDGKIIITGNFTAVGGVPRNNIARLNTDGSLDTSFSPNVNTTCFTSAVQPDGKILIGGYLSTVNGVPRNYIARLNADGSLDSSFNPNANYIVLSFSLQADGKILVGGHFNIIDGVARNGIARLNANGSIDSSFNVNVNENAQITTALQSDGKIIIGGYFNTIDSVTHNNIARLSYNDAAIQTVSVPGDGTSITWLRSGSAPEVENVTFEWSTELSRWAFLGGGARTSGGWQLSALSLPIGDIYIRSRGVAKGGESNASSSLIESVNVVKITSDHAAIQLETGKTFRDSLALLSVPPSDTGIGRLIKYPKENYETVPGLLDGLANAEAALISARDIYANRIYLGYPEAKESLLETIKTLANIYLMIGDEFLIDALEFRFSSSTIGMDEKLKEQICLLGHGKSNPTECLAANATTHGAQYYYEKAVQTFVDGFMPSSAGQNIYISDYFDDATFSLFNLASERLSSALREKSSKQLVYNMSSDPTQEWLVARKIAVQTIKDSSIGTYLVAAAAADKAVKKGVDFSVNGGDILVTTLTALSKQGRIISDSNLNPLGYDKRHVPMYEFETLASGVQSAITAAANAELSYKDATRQMDSDENAMRSELNSLVNSYLLNLFNLTGCTPPADPANPDQVLDYSMCVLPSGGDLFSCDVNQSLSDFTTCMATKETKQTLATKYQNIMNAQLRLNLSRLNSQNILAQIELEKSQHQNTVSIKRSLADQQSLSLEKYFELLKNIRTETDTTQKVTTKVCDKKGKKCHTETVEKVHTTTKSFALNSTELRINTDKEKEYLAATTEFEIKVADLDLNNRIANLLLNKAEADIEVDVAIQQKNAAVIDFDNALKEKENFWTLFERSVNQITNYYNSRIPTERILKSQAAIDLSGALNSAAHYAYLAAKALEYKYVSPIENQFIPGGNISMSNLFKAQTSADLQKFLSGLNSVNELNCPIGATSSQYNIISVAHDIIGVSKTATSSAKKAAMKTFLDRNVTADGREFGFTISSFNKFLLNPGMANTKIAGGFLPVKCGDFSNAVKGITVIIDTEQMNPPPSPLYSLSLSGHSTLSDIMGNIFDYIPAYSYQFMLNPTTENPTITSEFQYAYLNTNYVTPSGSGTWTNRFKARSMTSSGWSLKIKDQYNVLDYDQIKDIVIHIDTISQQ